MARTILLLTLGYDGVLPTGSGIAKLGEQNVNTHCKLSIT